MFLFKQKRKDPSCKCGFFVPFIGLPPSSGASQDTVQEVFVTSVTFGAATAAGGSLVRKKLILAQSMLAQIRHSATLVF